ncbi:MAG: CarD family transcriptional regulator [Rickettsiaceae bacterium]|nr:MAG: CarD family transcriptional regulator [Rickettsiaceae bacterium]
MSVKFEFNIGDRVVYPSHGVGEIINIEPQKVGDVEIMFYVISFPRDKMIVRVSVKRATISGLRTLADKNDLKAVYDVLKKVKSSKSTNKMWSRRAIEYGNKINSGNIIALAEVVRDLYKNSESERSYSERTIYESALNRLAREIAALETIEINEATNKLIEYLEQEIAA